MTSLPSRSTIFTSTGTGGTVRFATSAAKRSGCVVRPGAREAAVILDTEKQSPGTGTNPIREADHGLDDPGVPLEGAPYSPELHIERLTTLDEASEFFASQGKTVRETRWTSEGEPAAALCDTSFMGYGAQCMEIMDCAIERRDGGRRGRGRRGMRATAG